MIISQIKSNEVNRLVSLARNIPDDGYEPLENWAQAGELIEFYDLTVTKYDDEWLVSYTDGFKTKSVKNTDCKKAICLAVIAYVFGNDDFDEAHEAYYEQWQSRIDKVIGK